MSQKDPFWLQDYNILFNKHKLIEFVPKGDMSTDERLNAVTRFLIYTGVLLSIIYKSVSYLYIPIIGMAIIYMVHRHNPDIFGGDASEQPLQQPTQNNPFMNVLLTDYVENPSRAPAADIEDPDVKSKINEAFSTNLYRDVDDIWDRNNSQRQFYTNPATTIPNDRDSFMKWCYNTPNTCKDGNLPRCLRYEDVRANGAL
jgi:hypothetical protein